MFEKIFAIRRERCEMEMYLLVPFIIVTHVPTHEGRLRLVITGLKPKHLLSAYPYVRVVCDFGSQARIYLPIKLIIGCGY